MDIDALKGVKLDDTLHAQLSAFVASAIARAEAAETKYRAAKKEGAESQKGIAAERDAAFEKLGITDADELEALPSGRGAGDAAKQYEAKLKKAEREKAEALASLNDLNSKYVKDKRDLAIERAIGAQGFIDPEDARAILERRIKSEGDDFLFETADGKLVPLSDGAAFIAKTKPHLVKAPQGRSGSGAKPGDFSGAATAKNPWAKDTFNLTEQVRLSKENPQMAAQMKAAVAA